MFFAQDLMPGWLKRGTDIANSFDRFEDTWFDWNSSKDRVEKNTKKTNDWFGGDDSWGGMTDNMKTAATVAVDAAEGPENTGDLFAIGDAWGQEQDLEKKSQIGKDFAASAATLVGKKPKKDKDSADAAGRIYNIAPGNNALDQQGMDWSWENLPSFSTEQKPGDTLTGGKADNDLAGGSHTDNLLTKPLPPKDDSNDQSGPNQKTTHALAYADNTGNYPQITKQAMSDTAEHIQDSLSDTMTDALEAGHRAAAWFADDVLGLDKAGSAYRHFLDKKGTDVVEPMVEGEDPFVDRALKNNRDQFIEQTLVGDTGNGTLNKQIHRIKDGQTIVLNDHWEDAQSDEESVLDNLGMGIFDGLDNFLTYGRQHLKSTADIMVTRHGDELLFHGNAGHVVEDKYDFHEGREGGVVGAARLQNEQRGQPYTNFKTMDESFFGVIPIIGEEEDKLIFGKPQISWIEKR